MTTRRCLLNLLPMLLLAENMEAETNIVVAFCTPEFTPGQEGFLPTSFLAAANRYHQPLDRQRAIAGKLLLREILMRYFGYPHDVLQRVARTPLGAPVLLESTHHLSITHAGELVACAVGDAPVGIDLEQAPIEAFESCLRAFGASITAALMKKADPASEFLYLWTRTESVLKARGTGIINDLSGINVFAETLQIADELWYTREVATGRADHLCHVASRTPPVIQRYTLQL